MNELQITTLKLEPAVVEFNKGQVIKELNAILSKYESIVFTEENTTEIRKTLAELRKGRTTADTYRKDIKKELTEPVTEFEDEMKEITALFDGVINPLNDQLQEYEERRKEEKRIEVQTWIDEAVERYELEPKYAEKVILRDRFLNKTASTRDTKDSIDFMAKNALDEQQLEKANQENIETYVKLKNAEHGLNLSIVAYLSQLEFKSVDEVKNTIENDVNAQLKLIKKEKAETKKREQISELKKEVKPTFAVDDLPFGNIDEHTISFVITATETKLEELRGYLETRNYNWREE